ncbi:putative superfamily III holin-X [Streptomyces puniciscabiei]|uniref:Putative superfamily III holin-X n=1 Tax=Streptomyces puniciscabiei TaxID=164348 RepID=A0A542TII1_9ACTN|nr:phage holin family protein [Streptomyces puniciscabiei]TQK86610.1 putative superfamily III holin-X [Streptomyces puniciscabiei]
MRAQGDDTPAAGGVGDAAARPAQDTGELARKEIGAVRDEIMTALKRLGAGGLLLAGAGTCGVLALAAAHTTLLRALGPALPESTAWAVLSGAHTAGALGPAMAAQGRVRAAAQAAV